MRIFLRKVIFDELVKSLAHRHSGESRNLYPIENTGFRLSPE